MAPVSEKSSMVARKVTLATQSCSRLRQDGKAGASSVPPTQKPRA